MKISKKDLRKIIFENILKEAKTSVTPAGAKRSKAGNSSKDQQALLVNAKEFVEAAVKPLVKELDFFAAKINIGRRTISFNAVSARKGKTDLSNEDIKDIKGLIKAELKKSNDITSLRGMLKVGRRIKVNYKQTGNSQPENKATIEPDPDAPPKSPKTPAPAPPGGKCDQALGRFSEKELVGTDGEKAKVSNGYVSIKYDKGTSPYLYYVSKSTGCWYGLNKKNCKVFSMKKYPENMDNLDTEFEKARSEDLRARCAGKEKDSQIDPQITTPHSPGKVSIGEKAIIYLMAAGTNRTFGTLGPQIVKLYKSAKNNPKQAPAAKYKQVIASVRESNPNWKNVTFPAMKFVTPKSEGGILDLSNVNRGGLNTPAAFRAYAKNNGMGAALKLVLNSGGAFDLNGFDNAEDNKELMPILKNALGKYFSAPGGKLNEVFGKSRGTLIRERYWGRY